MLSDQVPYYIIDLLQQAPAVEIKGLGRFEAIFHPAVVETDASQIKPPSLRADFQEREIDQHHLLAAYIRYVSGAPLETAEAAIDAFVRNVHEQTSANEQYAIPKFGVFARSDAHGLRFTPDWDAFNLSFRGLETIDLREKKTVLREPPVAPDYKPEPVAETISHITKSEVISESEPKINLIPEIHPVDPRTGQRIEESTSRLWWIILIAALLLITVLCAYLAWDILSNRNRLDDLKSIYTDASPEARMHDSTTEVDSIPIEVNILPTDTLTGSPTPDEATPEEPVKEEPKPPPVKETQHTTGEYCYVVVGAFADPANVVRMEDRLTGLGYTPEQLKGRTITRVAIRTSCDKDTLQQVLAAARASVNPESWIY